MHHTHTLIVEPRVTAYDGAYFAELLLIDGSSLISQPFERRERANLFAQLTYTRTETTEGLDLTQWTRVMV
jgi:hypothetical protein